MNLAQAFAQAADAHGGKTAVFWGESEFSFDRIAAQAGAVARHLRGACGVHPGDRVAIWLRNCPEFIPILFGIFNAGAVVVPVNNFLKAQEVGYILDDAEANVLITEAAMNEAVAHLTAARPGLRVRPIEELILPEPPQVPFVSPPRSEADLAVIIYTSGTTGRPKGAMLSHGNLLHNVESCRQALEAVDFDRFVVLLPMFHSFMLTVGILLPLTVGGSLVLIKSLHPPKAIIQEVIARDATILPAIPQFFRALAHASLPPDVPLRLCISGAAPLPAEILREFTEKFSIPLIEGYGLSEASPVCSLNPIHGPRKAGSIGLPVADVELSIQDDAGAELGPGAVGEICVRGGNVMQGYWKRPDDTARAMRRDWLLTGDVGYRDAEGFYFITDRKKDMLLVNGINVYPREIEEWLYRFPGVKEAAVIGIPDARKGEQPLAFVAPSDGVTLDERALLGHLRENLADYKVPRRVVFLPALPRNATGKILKMALREMPAA